MHGAVDTVAGGGPAAAAPAATGHGIVDGGLPSRP